MHGTDDGQVVPGTHSTGGSVQRPNRDYYL